jgi:hypothetical protein
MVIDSVQSGMSWILKSAEKLGNFRLVIMVVGNLIGCWFILRCNNLLALWVTQGLVSLGLGLAITFVIYLGIDW